MKLSLSVDDIGVIKWYVDASYNVHPDCWGQTGAMMSLGKGAVTSFSKKQKLNVRSYTEGELVGIDDALSSILWTRYFIESQGYTIEQNILFQDNKSTILLANNGKWSSSKRTNHIRARYFFVKDTVDRGEVTIQYMPTDMMISGVNTKPLQGSKFYKFRADLMYCDLVYCDRTERERTHPDCLPTRVDASPKMTIPEPATNMKNPMPTPATISNILSDKPILSRVRAFPRQDCRSVLELSQNSRKWQTWSTVRVDQDKELKVRQDSKEIEKQREILRSDVRDLVGMRHHVRLRPPSSSE